MMWITLISLIEEECEKENINQFDEIDIHLIQEWIKERGNKNG